MSLDISAASHSKGPVFQFGIQVPRNVKDAYDSDAKNGNTKWAGAMQEIDSVLKFSSFKDIGKKLILQDKKILEFILLLLSNMTYATKLD
jgi:hypothetical protein